MDTLPARPDKAADTPHTLTAASAAAAASPWRVFRIASLAVFLVSLDATVVVAAFPALRTAFPGTSAADLSWVLNAYTIVYAALLVPAGRLADLLGRRRLFLQGVALFTLASALCGLAPSPVALIALRVLQAAGAALLTPASLALILRAFPPQQRAVAVSLWSAVGAFAAALGPAAGSWLIEQTSWPWIFLINLPIGLVTWWLARSHFVESTSPESAARPDLPGIALLVAGVGALALGIVKSEAWGWASAFTWGTILVGAVLLLGFVGWARDRPAAALDLALFDDRSYLFVNLATLVFGVAFTTMFLSFFLFVTGVWHYPQGLAGLAITPGPLMVIPVAIAAGRVAARVGHRPLLVGGGLLYALSNLWYAARIGVQPDYLGLWLPGQIVGGIAIGLVLPALSGAAAARLTPARFGVGNAVNNAIRQIGSVIGAALAIAMVGRVDAPLDAFRNVYLVLTCSALRRACCRGRCRRARARRAGSPLHYPAPNPRRLHAPTFASGGQRDARDHLPDRLGRLRRRAPCAPHRPEGREHDRTRRLGPWPLRAECDEPLLLPGRGVAGCAGNRADPWLAGDVTRMAPADCPARRARMARHRAGPARLRRVAAACASC